jgi:hypothetical protein
MAELLQRGNAWESPPLECFKNVQDALSHDEEDLDGGDEELPADADVAHRLHMDSGSEAE